MRLNELSDNPGATRKKMRIARGPGSGKGKMGGRGIKGYKSRSGSVVKGFEGGQMPVHRRLPKRGFNNPFAKEFAVVNLGAIQKFIDAGRIDTGEVVDEAALIASGLVRRKKDGVRVLAQGDLTTEGLKLSVTGASKAAIAAVEARGGSLTIAGSDGTGA